MNPTIKNHKDKVIGYKAVKKDGGGYYTDGIGNGKKTYFELGKTYSIKGDPILCKNGIHFFRHYCFALDYLDAGNVVLKVEAIGTVQEDTEKCVTNKIKILELEYTKEVDDNNNSGDWNSGYNNSGKWNSGYSNSGRWNSGDWDSGDWNSGDWNSGDRNSGNNNSGSGNSGRWNSGDWNSGYSNSGNSNSGYSNSGNSNSGYSNSGNSNSGDWNSGDRNSGNSNSGNGYRNYFCTKTRYFLFDVECEEKDIKCIDMSWFDLVDKTYKEAWAKCPKKVIAQIKRLKNFNADKFFEITGIRV